MFTPRAFDGEPRSSRGMSSSGNGDTYILPKKQKIFKCSIGRSEKGEDAALITLGSIGIPLAIVGLLGTSFGGNTVQAIIDSITEAITNIINGFNPARERVAGKLSAQHGKLAVALVRVLSPFLFKGMMRRGLSRGGKKLTSTKEPIITVEDIEEPDPRLVSASATIDVTETPPKHPTPTPIPLKFPDSRAVDEKDSVQIKARKIRG
jgi:hypothetical protein